MTREILRLSDEWPSVLDEDGSRRIDPPDLLYARGLPLPDLSSAVAVVGTRRPTGAGVLAARTIGKALAEAGFVVVSGLAVGIDAIAHRAALDAGGSTVAVVGAGLDNPYPVKNAKLRQDIEANGTVLSEHPDGTPVFPTNYPARNRIIAALSQGVVVVEGSATSGALITARLAFDAGKDVFAVPGSVRNPMAEAPNELIRNSMAKMITNVQHVFDELAPGLVWGDSIGVRYEKGRPVLDEDELAVLLVFDDTLLSTRALTRACSLPQGRLQLVLSRLEVRGLVSCKRKGWELTDAGARIRASAQFEGDLAS